MAAYSGQVAIMEYLVKLSDEDVGVGTLDGSTSLMAATLGNRVEAVKCLLNVRAEVNAATEIGMQALHMAAQNGRRLIAESLISARADMNRHTGGGRDPLDVAA